MENDAQKKIDELTRIFGSSEEEMLADVVRQHMAEMMMVEGFVIANAHRRLGKFAEWMLEEDPAHNILLEGVVTFAAQCIAYAHQLAHEVFQERVPEVTADFDAVREMLATEQIMERELVGHAIHSAGISAEQFRRYTTDGAFNNWMRRNGHE